MRSAWIATCLLLGWLAVAATAASVDPAIVNGHDAAGPGRYPWMVSLKYQGINKLYHGCGGSLINDGSQRIVLTAAHCFFDKTGESAPPASLTIGAFEFYADSEDFETYRIGPDDYKIHPKFVPKGFPNVHADNDIAIILLDKPSNKAAIKLPQFREKPHLPVDPGTMLTAIGWGDTSANVTDRYPNRLLEAEQMLQKLEQCQEVWKNKPAFMNPANTEICVGNAPNYTVGVQCSGDSGGPVFLKSPLNRPNEDKLIGIVSWGNVEACAGDPDVDTNVAQLVPWIYRTIAELLFQPLDGHLFDSSRGTGFNGRNFTYGGYRGHTLDILSSSRLFDLKGRLVSGARHHTVSLGSVNLRWRDEVDVSVDSHSRLIVKLGRRSLRPGTTEPLVGGKLVYGRDGTVSITKPGLSVRVTQPLVHPKRGHAYFASYLTLDVTLLEKPKGSLGGVLGRTLPKRP